MGPHTRTQNLSRWKICHPYPPPPTGGYVTGGGPYRIRTTPPLAIHMGLLSRHLNSCIYTYIRRNTHRTKTTALCNSPFNNTCTGTACATPFESQFSVPTLYGDVHGRSLWGGVLGTHIARKNRNRIERCKFVGGRGERTRAEFPIVAMHTHKEKTQHTPYSGGKKAKPEVYYNPKNVQ